MRRLTFHFELAWGKDEPEQEHSDTFTQAELAADPDRRPIGFWPASDPTRRDEDA